jgi:ATP-dependent helicase HepA
VKPDSEHVEYLALGHPVVDDLIARATSPSYAGSAAAFEIEADDMPSRIGWMVVYELGVPALKEVRELAAFFIDDAGTIDANLGQRLLKRAASFPNDRALSSSDVPADLLDSVLAVAEGAGFARLAELERNATAESTRQLERERSKLEAYFDYRDQAASDRLQSSQEILANLESAELADRRRIIPVWRANVARNQRLIEELAGDRLTQLAQLEHKSSSGGDLRLIAAARIEIVGGVEE